MKVSFTIAQKADGAYVVLYAGADVGKAVEAHNKLCAKPEGFIGVATFRKPMPIKRRQFHSEEANERWEKAIAEKAKADALEHENAKKAAVEKAKADLKAKGEAHAKAQAEAAAKRKADEEERIAEVRRLEAELQQRAAARAAARARDLGLSEPTAAPKAAKETKAPKAAKETKAPKAAKETKAPKAAKETKPAAEGPDEAKN